MSHLRKEYSTQCQVLSVRKPVLTLCVVPTLIRGSLGGRYESDLAAACHSIELQG